MASSEPAFPVPEVIFENQKHPAQFPGLTMRDYFAAQALPALIAVRNGNANMTPLDIVKEAFQYADMMVNVRSK